MKDLVPFIGVGVEYKGWRKKSASPVGRFSFFVPKFALALHRGHTFQDLLVVQMHQRNIFLT